MRINNPTLANILASLADWRLIWLVLLLPIVFMLPALPIDETRYLAVAWEMHISGNYLVPHLNGAIYSEKPPLLFWLINLSWSVLGMHVWSARVITLLGSLASLFLLHRLVLRLSGSRTLAVRAVWMLLGIVYFATFSSAIMFDVLLATCVLIALHGMLDLDHARHGRGVALIALGIGLGILAKGPVAILDVAFAFALAPFWSIAARANMLRWYALGVLGLLGGVLVTLAWVVPATLNIGVQNAQAILLHQTVGRVANSFAHQRPLWWYAMVFPLMLLPWPLVLRAPFAAWGAAISATQAGRFALLWSLPTFIAFCFVSGKQPHYLLPIMPGVALILALVFESPAARVRGRLFGALLLILGIALLSLALTAANPAQFASALALFNRLGINSSEVDAVAGLWPLWGACIILIGGFLLLRRSADREPRTLAICASAAVLALMLAQSQALRDQLDVTAAAAQIRAAQERGQPIAHIGWHHGLFEFAGRLTTPLPSITFAQVHEWCIAHPDGLLMTFNGKYPIPVAPFYVQDYRFGHIWIWRASDMLAAHIAEKAPANPMDDKDDDDTQ